MSAGMGCHNPRLDSDNVTCDPAISDPTDPDFCTPENINVDFPPKDQWIRIGVHHFSHHGSAQPTFPNVKIFCDGALAADLGNAGFYSPPRRSPSTRAATTPSSGWSPTCCSARTSA